MSLYPDESTITLPNGHHRRWPGLKDGKFSNGSPGNPADEPSGIPAETINLVVDLLESFIREHGLAPNNTDPHQISGAFKAALRTRQAIFKDFGAIADGIWDCSALFATVVDTFGGELGVIRLTEGSYVLQQLTIPENIIVKFEPGAKICVPATKQLVINGLIEAGPFAIFAGQGNIISQRDFTVLPEWWADYEVLGSEPLAYAYNFLSSLSGGTIKLQSRNYVSPFTNIDAAIKKDNIRIVGGMTPTVALDKSRLQIGSGTILLGTVCVSANNFDISDLGIDSGSWVCEHLAVNSYAGPGADCLVFVGGPDGKKNLRLRNIQTLGKAPNSTYHGILIERYTNVYGSNLRTHYCSHGVAVKSTHVEIHGVYGESHDFDSVIVKAEAAIPCSDVNIYGVFATSTGDHDGTGVLIQAYSGDVSRVRILGLTAINVKWALQVYPNTNAQKVTDVLIDGIQVDSVRDHIKLLGTGGFNIERLTLRHGAIRNSPSLGVQLRHTRECVISDLSISEIVETGSGRAGVWTEVGNYHLRFQSLWFAGVDYGITNTNGERPIFVDGLIGDGVAVSLVNNNAALGVSKTALFNEELVESKYPGVTSLGTINFNGNGVIPGMKINSNAVLHVIGASANLLVPEGLFTLANAAPGSTVLHYLTGQSANLAPGDWFIHRYA